MKAYLGDGVYANMLPSGVLRITTENGIIAENIIILEPEVFGALLKYVKTHTTWLGASKDSKTSGPPAPPVSDQP